ncbi:MAG: AAA family ATPase [Candidatus Buchananbacteria bacterium]
MFLQRIELQGFKSFANKTVLEFPAPDKKSKTHGITAIVGPNGSGKSNVVDACRWVLGEQSLKLLRGKKATDIIFSGSAKKSQMGMAEVSLFLNNEDNSAPIEYSELAISRKIYRDGTSQYFINKNEVRLFDIVMLLAKANFGQNTYGVIGQGMVDKIVNYSTQERKEFFDEATGVKQFQIKRDRSVNKLKKSRENVTQADVLIKELEPHLKSLTRQVNKLRQRQQLEAELKDEQIKYYAKIWSDLNTQYDQFAISYNNFDKQKNVKENRLGELSEELEEMGEQSGRVEGFDKLQSEYDVLTTEKNSLLQELTVVRGKMDLEYSKVGKQNLSWLENKKEEISNYVKEIESEEKITTAKLQKLNDELKRKQEEINKINGELTVWQNNFQILQDEFYRSKNGEKINYSLEPVKAVLRLKNTISGVYGAISQLGKIEPKHEAALSVAAGNRLWAIVVDSDETAVKCINYLKENRLGTVTFFPLNKLSSYGPSRGAEELANERGAVGLAIDLVKFDSKYQKAFEQVFGSTVVVEDLQSAREIGVGRERMVTLDGDTLEKSGVMKGGFKKSDSMKWAVLDSLVAPSSEDKIRQLTELKTKVDKQLKEKENLISEISEIKTSIQVLESGVRANATQLQNFKKEKEKIESEIKESQLTPQEQDEFFKNLKSKRTELEKSLEQLDKKSAVAKEKIDKFNSVEEEKKQKVFSVQQEMHNLQNELNAVVNSFNEVKIELAKIETKKENAFASMKEDLGEEYMPKTSVDITGIDPEESKIKIDKIKKSLEMIGGIDPEIENEYKQVSERFDFLSKESEDLHKAIIDLEKVVVELDKIIKKQFEDEFKKINADFTRYFKQLFDGGVAKLVLTQKEMTEAESAVAEVTEAIAGEETPVEKVEEEKKIVHVEDKSFLANMGIEIEACPPGKKIKNITSLSGGEKTMTALALICSIISNNPSPFILFDEVDAALDESNSSKFSLIIEELAHKTQFIVITHNRAIMSHADVLYGVTMQGDGVSRMIGLKLSEAEKLAE